MIAISNDFKTAMQQPVKELTSYLKIVEDDTIISDDEELISFKISCESDLSKSAMRKLEAKYIGNRDILDKWVKAYLGVKLENGEYEYIDYGSFQITEMTYSADTETTNVSGYDKMISSMVRYEPLEIEYPIGLYDYTVLLCNAIGLSLKNESFSVLNNWQLTQELWENIDGITYRDIFEEIAQVTCSTVMITTEDEIYFKQINTTGETLTYDNLIKLKLEAKYGEINSVILGRENITGEDVFMKDDESIELNGLTEFRIDSNQIVDKDRENAIAPIYNVYHGINYFPFEADTEGLGYFEIADAFNIENEDGDIFNCVLFNYSISIDGGIKEHFKTEAKTKTETKYQYASKISRRIANTEIIVDKQNQTINSVVTLVDGIDERSTEIAQGLDGIEIAVETLKQDVENNYATTEDVEQLIINSQDGLTNIIKRFGGTNLIRNSALLFATNEGYEYWNGELERGNADQLGIVSETKTAILTSSNGANQSIELTPGIYTLSFKYKKLLQTSDISFKVNEEVQELLEDEGEFEKTINLETTNITIDFSSSIDNGYAIYDLMLNKGEEKATYTQHANETTTDTVKIGEGISVESATTDTTTKIDSDGFRVVSKGNQDEVLLRATDTGTYTKTLKVVGQAEITGLYIQEVNNQTWITGII